MSTLRPVIFISAVSKELHTARALVSQTLTSLGYDPKSQDIAPTETGMLPQVLRDWIDQSDAVIQLVGHRYGFAPKEPDAEFGEYSYTQLEALYARQQGKKVWYLILTPEHPTDPCDAEAHALSALQDAYRAKVTGADYLYHLSSSLTQTENIVLKMRDDLAELRQKELARQAQLQQTIEATHQNTAEILARFADLNQQANRQPQLLFKPESWPQPAPFHNRTFPPQQNFVGRATLLSAMKQSLDAGRDIALTQPVAMHGAGGIGKTRAAVEFARAHGSAYTLRLFLDAQSPDSLRASLAEVARRLELTTDPQAKEEALVLLALRLLRAVPSALVVADNADTLAALEAVRLLCHQPGGVRWLITTRLTNLGEEFAPQRVDLLDEPDAVQLLQKRASKSNHQPGPDADARAVALELGRLPLALQQAAAYVAHMRLTWTAYSKLLAENPTKALSHEASEMKDLPDGILRTYRISLQQLTPLARELLEIAAHLAPAPIPEAVFLQDDEFDGLQRAALAELADLSLVEWEPPTLEMHRAIAIAVRLDIGLGRDTDLAEKTRARLSQACRRVTVCAPRNNAHPSHWPAWAALRPHIEHLLAQAGPAGVAEEVCYLLLVNWPIHLQVLGEYVAAEAFCCRAVAYSLKSFGSDHQNTLGSRNNLANVLWAQGKYAEAEQEHRAVLEIRKRVLGEEHPDTLSSRNNLATALYDQGKYAEAEQEYRAVLEIRKRELEAEHPNTLSCRNNLANVLNAQGKHAEAEQEFWTVLGSLKRVLGVEHPQTLMSQMNLANALLAQGKYAEAEHEHRMVLESKERVLGAKHPHTLSSRNHLANSLWVQGKLAEAEQEHRSVLEIRKHVLGTNHPETLMSRMNLAKVMFEQGRHAYAEQEYRAILKVQVRVLGAEHPDVALTCCNLALCLESQGQHSKLAEALPLMQRAEQIWQKVLGSDHPDTKDAKEQHQRLEAELKKSPSL
ncbi:FxSxx-COOH system tetratricopeptide repeat protein [Prosthecobacter fluviatilis]|uniref:FxSxx-COOH system tetratricopeptide repeat protein n=1 Tax=Prosthecobacter fluviatilis TaxID=445931 RepID=A0ABW0KV61_9BACT